MIETFRAIARFFGRTIGWNRIGFVLSLVIITIAAAVLYRILRGIDTNEVLEAIKSTEPRDIAFAGLFVAAGYFTLTFYDLFALRTIGAETCSAMLITMKTVMSEHAA